MMKQSSLLLSAGAAALATLATACLPTDTGEETLVQIAIPLVNDQCGVTRATVEITASDINERTANLDVSGDSIAGVIADVPAGPERLVTVTAYGGPYYYNVVYQGSAIVDVTDGATVQASLVLYRNWDNCPATSGSGDIDVLGELDNGTAGGAAVHGQFRFNDAKIAAGVIYFLDAGGDRVRRLDLATQAYLAPLRGTLSPISGFAVASDGATAYVAYEGGRIDAFDTATGTPRLFGVAPSTVSALTVAGSYLFAIEGGNSSYYTSHALYSLATGDRVTSVTGRNSGRDLVYSPVNQRVYFVRGNYDSGIISVPVGATGTIGSESTTPYNGGNSIPGPMRLSANEQYLLVGNGSQYRASDLTYVNSIGLPVIDAAFAGGDTYVISRQGGQYNEGGQTLIRSLDAGRTITGNRIIPGAPLRVFPYATQLVVVSQLGQGHIAARYIDLPL